MLYWLLSHEALQLRVVRSIREARTPLTVWEPKARVSASAGALPAPLTIANGVATIRVEGVLTPTPDMMAEIYGEPNTTYADLQASLQVALDAKDVRSIVWSIDSHGGSVDGLFQLLDAIETARESSAKPMSVEAMNAHSAAYGIAAAVGGTITALSRVASFGSVGVATSGFIQGGICGTVVDMTNSDSPDKRPDLSTEAGKAVVVAYLDQLAEQFMGSIARGRRVEPDAVRTGYGRGASMLAEAARDAGMIDAIRDPRARDRADLTNVRTYDTVASSMAEEKTPAPSAPPVPVAAPPAVDAQRLLDENASLRTQLAARDAKIEEFVAERQAREAAERRTLVTALVELGAEIPATAWVNDAPAARLAAEPIADMRARVEALRAAKPKASDPRPPATDDLADLSEAERAQLPKFTDAKRREKFIAGCRERREARDAARRK